MDREQSAKHAFATLDLFQKTLYSAFFNSLKRDPIDSGSPAVSLGHLVGFIQRFRFAEVNIQSPKAPGWFSLRLDVYAPPQVLQTDGCFYHSPLPSFCWGHYPQQGLFAPRPLRRFSATTGPPTALSPFRRFPGFASYTASLLPAISRPRRVGLLQLLSASLSSCCGCNPARVSRHFSQFATVHAAFA